MAKVIVLSCWTISLDEIILCWFSTQSSDFIYISVFYFIYKKNMNDLALTLIHKEKIIFASSIIISSARNFFSLHTEFHTFQHLFPDVTLYYHFNLSSFCLSQLTRNILKLMGFQIFTTRSRTDVPRLKG